MHVSRWLVRFGMSSALVFGSALCAGWKWELFLH
jgi:hypothetical protein